MMHYPLRLDLGMLNIVALFAASVATLAAATSYNSTSPSWDLAKFESLVVFGDSYSDDSRLSYFESHNGSAPPVGWVDPAVSLLNIGSGPVPLYHLSFSRTPLLNQEHRTMQQRMVAEHGHNM